MGHGKHPADRVMVGRKADAFARTSGWALRWLYRAAAGQVRTTLPRDGACLDVGTGPGRLLVEVARQRPDAHVVGVDPSADMIGHARGNVGHLGDRAELFVASAESLPFPDESFDAVVSTLSAHHWADPAAAVAEQVRVLRPGGRLWIFDLRKHTAAALPALLAEHFAADEISRPRLPWLPSVALVCHQATR